MKWLEKILEIFAACILSLMVISVLIQVFSRYIGTPLVWTEELTKAFLVYGSLLGGGLAYYKGQGFKITFVLDNAPSKIRKVIELLILFVSLVLLGFILHSNYLYIYQISGNQTPLLNIPNVIILISFPLGILLIIIRLIKDFKNVIKNN